VLGVHLRSGLRSYYSNGYLVVCRCHLPFCVEDNDVLAQHPKYPKTTVQSIGTLLKTMSDAQRQDTVSHIKALQPILNRFGARNMVEALEKVVHD